MMTHKEKLLFAQHSMEAFCASSGLTAEAASPRRYLWTDAFAVCNLLELYRQKGEEEYLHLARQLIRQVHLVLGTYRYDDTRTGWISGLAEEEGAKHPTIGGLRIGKRQAERGVNDPYDEHLEWERDGQYYHYLTKWMHALLCMSLATREQRYHRWAIELASAAYHKFSYQPHPQAAKRLYWKMSTDLSYPLVSSSGQHDPLEGLLIYCELEALRQPDFPSLNNEIQELSKMCRGRKWFTLDPLGIGALLEYCYRGAQLLVRDALPDASLLWEVMNAAVSSLDAISYHDWSGPARLRLAFRELGLAIGVQAIRELIVFTPQHPLLHQLFRAQVNALSEIVNKFPKLERFWLNLNHQKNTTWTEYADINSVMLVTALLPHSYLDGLTPPSEQIMQSPAHNKEPYLPTSDTTALSGSM